MEMNVRAKGEEMSSQAASNFNTPNASTVPTTLVTSDLIKPLSLPSEDGNIKRLKRVKNCFDFLSRRENKPVSW